MYLIYNILFRYTKYTNITINEININYLDDKKSSINKINKLESIINELVYKNNKLELIVVELVSKNNNLEELRNEMNVYKSIVNNLITTNK